LPRHFSIILTLLLFLLAGILPVSASRPSFLESSSLASCVLPQDMQGNTAGLTNQAGNLIDRINYPPSSGSRLNTNHSEPSALSLVGLFAGSLLIRRQKSTAHSARIRQEKGSLAMWEINIFGSKSTLDPHRQSGRRVTDGSKPN
jgi:hypothetical protein